MGVLDSLTCTGSKSGLYYWTTVAQLAENIIVGSDRKVPEHTTHHSFKWCCVVTDWSEYQCWQFITKSTYNEYQNWVMAQEKKVVCFPLNHVDGWVCAHIIYL